MKYYMCSCSLVLIIVSIYDTKKYLRKYMHSILCKTYENLEIYGINDGNSSNNIISIEEWLKNIYEAATIITDSFHGCVFSILFNKPFYAFINKERGADRFYSLFEMFDLFDRIIDCNNFSQKNINYKKVNEIIKEQKEFSKNFLISNLKVNNAK